MDFDYYSLHDTNQMATSTHVSSPRKHRGWLMAGVFGVVVALSGCSGLPPAPSPRMSEASLALPEQTAPLSVPASSVSAEDAWPESPAQIRGVVIYASPVAQAHWARTAFDGRLNIQLWQTFLRKYKIPFQLITAVEQLEKTRANALILPSAVALSDREKKAIAAFRLNGGSVLATWLTGVQNERGTATGYQFMEDTLGVKVAGDTEKEAKDNFLIAHGSNPITHHLPAGQRIWLDRVKGLYPLRLEGRHTAARIMDWSRKTALDKVSGTVVFDERLEPSGLYSRSVVLGFSEQLWISADAKQMEALVHNALWWVLRLPSAYTAPWPHPHRSAFVLAVDVAGALSDRDLDNARLLEQAGGRATYYVVNETAVKSAERLKQLQSTGHEIAYLGDQYSDFREQPPAVQAQRLDNMLKTMSRHGLAITPHAGFHPPMDSYDRNTEKLLGERAFGYVLGTMEATEARWPMLLNEPRAGTPVPPSGRPNPLNRMLVLPRTQEGPDELVDNCNPEIGLKPFFRELQLSEQMASLSIVPFPGRTELTDAQRMEVFTYIGSRREHKWLTTARQVAQWWHERERVSILLTYADDALRLSVTIAPGPALKHAPAVWVNRPEIGSTLLLTAPRGAPPPPRLVEVDAWRSAVVLDGLAPGQYSWNLRFERASPGPATP